MTCKKTLNVFFVIDKNFIIHFTVALTSLLENNKDLDISVYVIHDLEDVKILENVITFFNEKYSVKLNLAVLSNSVFSNIPNNFPGTTYISKAAYFRLLLSNIIPVSVLSGLYIDCDTIVTGSLKQLLDLNFFSSENNEEHSLLAVGDNKGSKEIVRLNKLGVNSKFYFNSGVMLVNLKKWRLDNASDELIKILERYKGHLKWLDQDVLNIYFINRCGKLSITYNTITNYKLSEMPLIIHFSGESKPWNYINNGPYKFIYRKYLKMTPFKDEKFEVITVKKIKQKYVLQFKQFLKLEA